MLRTRLDEHLKPAQKSLKNRVKRLLAQNFPRLRRAQRGFAFEAVLLRPESATLAVTIIPVSLAAGVGTPGPSRYHAAQRALARLVGMDGARVRVTSLVILHYMGAP